VSELYRPSNRRLSTKLVPTLTDRRCHVVSVRNPYDRILWLLNRSRYFFFQLPPQLYSRSWVDPVPNPLLLRKSGSASNRTWTSGSVARQSDYRSQRRSRKEPKGKEIPRRKISDFPSIRHAPHRERKQFFLGGGDKQTKRQHGNLLSLLLFLHNKESRLNTKLMRSPCSLYVWPP
jgi:hypothetical protein